MLIMRMYALYERSRKVLALYIIVAVAILLVGCVSPIFSGKQYLSNILLLTQWAMLDGKEEKPREVQIRTGCGANVLRDK